MKPKFWPCGGDSGLGCGCEVWGHMGRVLRYARGKRAVFCERCADKITGKVK